MYEKVERLLNQYGVSAYRLCKDTGLPRSTLSQWKAGTYKPKYDKIKRIAEYFDVPIEYFYGDDAPAQEQVFEMSAGQGRLNEGYEYAPHDSGEQLTVRICGDSMYPSLHDGDMVKVIPAKQTDPQDYTVVKINGDEATCKHVEITDTGLWLRGENPDAYTDRFYTVQEVLTLPIQIIGKVVSLERTL